MAEFIGSLRRGWGEENKEHFLYSIRMYFYLVMYSTWLKFQKEISYRSSGINKVVYMHMYT